MLINVASGRHAHEFFSEESRGLLRCVWAFKEEEWIELPGPAEIWPDDPAYYIRHGFEVRPERASLHLRALKLLAETKPPRGWMNMVVHENDRNELIWQRNYQPMY